MKGRGVGPGGMRYHVQMSLRRITTSMAIRPTQVYQEVSADRIDIMISSQHLDSKTFEKEVIPRCCFWFWLRGEAMG